MAGLSQQQAEDVAKTLGSSGSHMIPGGGYGPCASSSELLTIIRRAVKKIHAQKDVFSGMPSGSPSNFGPVLRSAPNPQRRPKRKFRKRVILQPVGAQPLEY